MIERLRVRIPPEAAGEFCVLTLFRYPFHPHVTPVARKRPRSFCQKCKWQAAPKHTYTIDPTKSEWAMPLSRHSVGTSPETSSHATCQGTLGHSCLSSLSHCGLILHKEWNLCARANLHFKKKKKKVQTENEWSNILPKSSQARKKPPPPAIRTTTPLRTRIIFAIDICHIVPEMELRIRDKLLAVESQSQSISQSIFLSVLFTGETDGLRGSFAEKA